MRKEYQTIEIKVLLFSASDILTLSDDVGDDIFSDWQ